MAENGEHPAHKWISSASIVAALFGSLVGAAASWGASWAAMGAKITAVQAEAKSLRETVAKLNPAPTAHEQECAKIMEAYLSEVRTTIGGRGEEVRKIAETAGCIPKD